VTDAGKIQIIEAGFLIPVKGISSGTAFVFSKQLYCSPYSTGM